MATTLDKIGGIHARRKEYEKAVEYHQRSRELAARIGYVRGEFTATGKVGVAFAEMHDDANALDYLPRAIDGHRAIGYLENLRVWLAAAANVVVNIVSQSEALPDSLKRFPAVQSEGWKEGALVVVESLAQEALDLSDQLERQRERDARKSTLARVTSMCTAIAPES